MLTQGLLQVHFKHVVVVDGGGGGGGVRGIFS